MNKRMHEKNIYTAKKREKKREYNQTNELTAKQKAMHRNRIAFVL